MSESLIGQIITAIVTLGVALIGYLKLKSGQDNIRKDVDGKMTQLLEVTGAKERSEGKAEGKLEQREDTKAEGAKSVQADQTVTDADAKKVADTVVDTVKADPEIEVKKTGKLPGKKL